MNPIRSGMGNGLYFVATLGEIEGLFEDIEIESIIPLATQVTKTGNTVLHIHVGIPASKGRIPKIQFIETILHHQASLILQKNDNGEIPLHLAARFGHVNVVQVFIEHARADGRLREMLMMTDERNDTALHQAVRWKNVEIVGLLVNADLNCEYDKNVDDETPLYIAVERNYPTLVAKILDGCVTRSYVGPLGRTVLHAAALWGHQGTLEKILKAHKLLLRSQDGEGITPLLESRDNEGKTPLHYAAGAMRRTKGPNQSLEILLQFDDATRSAIYIQDCEGRTALHIAAMHGDVDRLSILIQHRQDCSEIKDNKGQNLFHYAANSGCQEKIQFLMNCEIFNKHINEKNEGGNTPLHLLASSVRYAPTSYFLCSRDFTKNKDVDLMVFNNQNETPGDIMHSYYILDFLPHQRGIASSINEVTPYNLRASFKEKPDESQLSKLAKRRYDLMLDLQKRSEAHLIVATLIATVSFAAGIAVPGGFNQELGYNQGVALLTRTAAFRAFMMFDALALTSSALAILILFHITRMKEPSGVYFFYPWSVVFTLVSIGAMMVAFMAGAYAIVGQSPSLASMTLVFPAIFLFLYIGSGLRLGFLVWKTTRRPSGLATQGT